MKERAAKREARLRQEDYWCRTAEERGCLFCRGTDGAVSAREHVFPESLGNTEIVLPPGVVCDRCNNGTLSDLDQAICGFMPVAVRKLILGVASKSGKIPSFRFSEGTVEHIPSSDGADPKLIFNSRTTRGLLRETGRLPDGRVSLEWKGSGGRRMTARYASQLSRALLKSALECAWIDHGKMVFEPRFDHIRAAVLDAPRDGFFAMLGKADPNSRNVSLTYELLSDDGEAWRMLVWA
ncbi:MAG: HNH endonuclease, partial [Chloroflexota bacterium]